MSEQSPVCSKVKEAVMGAGLTVGCESQFCSLLWGFWYARFLCDTGQVNV